MYLKQFIFLLIITYAKSDIEFRTTSSEVNKRTPLEQIKNSYDQFIDDIITKGVTDLGFSLHKSAKKYSNAADYLVYSPVSIATALYMLLLGSNGQTFTELSEILGLAHGLNIANNSIKVHEEFGELLHNLETNNSNTLVRFANGLFVQNDFPLRQQYLDVSSLVYESETMNLDFRGNPNYAKDVINNWTSNKTYGKIQSILNESPSSDTKVVICSTLYFKADWNVPFSKDYTTTQTFYPNGKSSPSNIKFTEMAHKSFYPYYKDPVLNCEVLGLPYKGNEYTFYILLPQNSNKDILKQFESRLTYSDLKRLTSNTTLKELLIAIPKMKLTSTLQLNEVLQDNGLRSLFSPAESNLELLSPSFVGDEVIPISSVSSISQVEEQPFVFSRSGEVARVKRKSGVPQVKGRSAGIPRIKRQSAKVLSSNTNFDSLRRNLPNNARTTADNLYVSKILHKVIIDVDEKGTEAAAATAELLTKKSVPLFKVNVPFVFFIQHDVSKMILFWGSVVKPSPTF